MNAIQRRLRRSKESLWALLYGGSCRGKQGNEDRLACLGILLNIGIISDKAQCLYTTLTGLQKLKK